MQWYLGNAVITLSNKMCLILSFIVGWWPGWQCGRLEIIFLPYAFIDVKPSPGKIDLVFDEWTAKIRAKAIFDPDNLFTKRILKTFGEQNPLRLHIQYIDNDGAKFGIGMSTGERDSSAGLYEVNVQYIIVNLGYDHAGVSADVVNTKITELVKDAEAACESSNSHCTIRVRHVP
jgi:hypothetical protein